MARPRKSATPGPGHNSDPTPLDADRLRSIVQRVERLAVEKQALQGDISDIFTEAKRGGFDAQAIRVLLKIRATDPNERSKLDLIVAQYHLAVGDGEDEDL